ncbi:MAG TPA: hypothetical protein VMU84_10265, partial [Thermoanaerobaculia bacterium]|nr:hypothetical protein [Thermoanaerobaculia bacterium]
EFEDAHVQHKGGEMYPQLYTMARFLYRGGWIVRAGDSMTFLAKRGASTLHYSCGAPAMIELGGRAYLLEPQYKSIRVDLDHDGRVTLRGISGEVNLDRMQHE